MKKLFTKLLGAVAFLTCLFASNPAFASKTVYFDNTGVDWAGVGVYYYAFNSDGNSGFVAMDPVSVKNGFGIYKATLDDKWVNVIFLKYNGWGDNDSNKLTGDCKIVDGHLYKKGATANSEGEEYNPEGGSETPEEPETPDTPVTGGKYTVRAWDGSEKTADLVVNKPADNQYAWVYDYSSKTTLYVRFRHYDDNNNQDFGYSYSSTGSSIDFDSSKDLTKWTGNDKDKDNSIKFYKDGYNGKVSFVLDLTTSTPKMLCFEGDVTETVTPPTTDWAKYNKWYLKSWGTGSKNLELTGDNDTYTTTQSFKAGETFKFYNDKINATGDAAKYWRFKDNSKNPYNGTFQADNTDSYADNSDATANMVFDADQNNVTITFKVDANGNMTEITFSGITGSSVVEPEVDYTTYNEWSLKSWGTGSKNIALTGTDGVYTTTQSFVKGETFKFFNNKINASTTAAKYWRFTGEGNEPKNQKYTANNTDNTDNMSFSADQSNVTITFKVDENGNMTEITFSGITENTTPVVTESPYYIRGWQNEAKVMNNQMTANTPAEGKYMYHHTGYNRAANGDLFFRIEDMTGTTVNYTWGANDNEWIGIVDKASGSEKTITRFDGAQEKNFKFNGQDGYTGDLWFVFDPTNKKMVVYASEPKNENPGPVTDGTIYVLRGDVNDWLEPKLNSKYSDADYKTAQQEKWTFVASENATYPAKDGWLQLNVNNLTKDGKFWGQFKVCRDGKWGSEGGKEYGSNIVLSEDANWLKTYFSEAMQMIAGKTYKMNGCCQSNDDFNKNMHLAHNAYTNTVLYFNPGTSKDGNQIGNGAEAKCALSGDAVDYYVYYAKYVDVDESVAVNPTIKAKLLVKGGNTENYYFNCGNFGGADQYRNANNIGDLSFVLPMEEVNSLTAAGSIHAANFDNEGDDYYYPGTQLAIRKTYVAKIPNGFENPAGPNWMFAFDGSNDTQESGLTHVINNDNVWILDGVHVHAKSGVSAHYDLKMSYRVYGQTTDFKVQAYKADWAFDASGDGEWHEMTEFDGEGWNVNKVDGAIHEIPAAYGTQYIQFRLEVSPKAAETTMLKAANTTVTYWPREMTIGEDDNELRLPGADYYFTADYMTTGVEEIEVEDVITEEAAPVYFNLQGVKVANPVKGQLYIVVKGKKSEKVIF